MVGSGTRNARAISAVVSPPNNLSVSASCASVAIAGVAAGEHQAQPIVLHVVFPGFLVRRHHFHRGAVPRLA